MAVGLIPVTLLVVSTYKTRFRLTLINSIRKSVSFSESYSYIGLLDSLLLHLLTSLFILRSLRRLVNDLHQVSLEGLLLKLKSVLVPDEVRDFWVPAILLHASLKKT